MLSRSRAAARLNVIPFGGTHFNAVEGGDEAQSRKENEMNGVIGLPITPLTLASIIQFSYSP
jgi:hypothetical protein